MSGPAPTPTEVKKRNGNPGKRPLNKLEPQPESGVPAMPKGMSAVARRKWCETVPILVDMGVLTMADGDALLVYCESWAAYISAIKVLRKEGSTYKTVGTEGQVLIKTHPAVVERDKAQRSVERNGQQFGLTPASRSRVKTNAPVKAEDPADSYIKRKPSTTASGTTGSSVQ